MRKVLMIKLSSLGDVMIAVPHLETIVGHHGGDEVWFMTSPSFASLFSNHPRLHLVVLDRKRHFGRTGLMRSVLWMRRQKLSVIYDLQGNRISRLLVRFGGAGTTVGTQPKSIYNCHPIDSYTRNTERNVFDRLNETLVSAGIPAADTVSTLYPSREDIDKVKRWKEKNGLMNKGFVVVHAGSSSGWPSKRWSKDNFYQLAQRFEGLGLKCVWIGDDEDRLINQWLGARVGLDATGIFSLLQVYELGKGATFAVTNDSGPMHILAAAGIPVYSFFGPTSWIRSHAVGQRDRVLWQDVECGPCFQDVCPERRGHICLQSITPETVFNRIDAELNLSG